jgi:hypothetical protein
MCKPFNLTIIYAKIVLNLVKLSILNFQGDDKNDRNW